jgi:hypothetical protein
MSNNKYNHGCPMERALNSDQCAVMRDFLVRAVQYAQNHSKIDARFLIREYRVYRNGSFTINR